MLLERAVNPRTMNAMPIPAISSPNSTRRTIPPGVDISCALKLLDDCDESDWPPSAYTRAVKAMPR